MSKNIYATVSVNYRQGIKGDKGEKGDKGDTGDEGPAGTSTLSGCTDVNINSPQNNNTLKYDSTSSKWINVVPNFPVTTVFGRSGSVTSQAGDYNIGQIYGVDISSPVIGQMLSYNNGNWQNKNCVIYREFSFNPGAITAALDSFYVNAQNITLTIPTCAFGDAGRRIMIVSSQSYTTTVQFTNPVNLTYLSYYTDFSMTCTENGTLELIVVTQNQYVIGSMCGKWTNTLGLKPLNAVMANLNTLTDVNITSPTDRQLLIHNGTSWINRQPTENIAYNMQVVNTVSLTMAVNTTYLSTNCVLTLPTSANVGDTIKVMVADALNTTVTFPAGIYLVYAGAHLENFSMTVNTGSITLVYYRTNTWWPVSIGGVWSSTHGFVKNFRSGYSELNDIKNVSITSPTNNQMLKYNGTNWVNFTDYETNYVALSDNSSITGVPNTTYVLTNSTLIMPVGAFGETIKVVVNGVVNSWITFGSGTNYVYNGTTYSSRTINSNTGSITFQCYSGSYWWPTSISGTWTNL